MAVMYRAIRALRTKVVPLIVWVATIGVAVWMYQDIGTHGAIVGIAQGIEYRVAALYPGRVVSISVEVGQAVRAGQVIATLDPQSIDAEIRIQETERERLKATITASEAGARLTQATEERRLDMDLEDAQVALAEAQATARTKAAELRALAEQRRSLKELVESRMASRQALAETDVRYAALKKETEEARAAIDLLKTRVDAAEQRHGGLPTSPVDVAVAPLQREVETIEERLLQLRAQREEMVLRAPAAGRVAEVAVRPGEVAAAGMTIAKIMGSATGRVIACVSEKQAMEVKVGDPAMLWPKGMGGQPLMGRAVSLGPIVDEVPSRCRPVPTQPAWGRDVVILLNEPAELVPGMAFDVRLDQQPVGTGEAIAAPPDDGDAPLLMSVPASLAERSRFEPSGLVWAQKRARYVIVSDDTGQKDRLDHAPWLFTMDAQGHVDAEPLRIEGVAEVNDLESIAQDEDGRLYVLSSQSHSKKGKRKASRQAFMRLAPSGDGYRVEATVHLAELLDQAGPEALARLGLGADTWELNIEGMCPDRGGLLLGLKGPVDGDGNALIWRLADPDRLFRTGSLDEGGLALWGRVRLRVEAEGKEVPGGIAELLKLPDATLLIGATASGMKPKHQTGALYMVPSARPGVLDPRLVRTFPGLKPEALALSPEPGNYVIAFDTDAATPQWLEVPWPRP